MPTRASPPEQRLTLHLQVEIIPDMQVLDNCTAARVANSTQFLRRNGSAARSSSNDHSLKYIGDHGENTSEVAFQECSSAPVETRSPLGYSVGPVTIIFLNISSMIGTGIFSTRMSPTEHCSKRLTVTSIRDSSRDVWLSSAGVALVVSRVHHFAVDTYGLP